MLLAAWGYEVETAPDRRAALDKASEIHTDAVIADLRMPTMDGLQLLRALHHAEPDLSVIVITGQGVLGRWAGSASKSVARAHRSDVHR